MSKLTYFSHFVISNEGKEPAFELEIALLDNEKKLLQGKRETVLMIGEKVTWEPNVQRQDGNYYLVCQYKNVAKNNDKNSVHQTWLLFKLTEAQKSGEVYIAPDNLYLKTKVLSSEMLKIF